MDACTRTQKKKTITDDWGGSHAYTVTLHPAEDGFNLLPRLTNILGPSLANVVGSVSGVNIDDFTEADIDGDALGRAIGALASELIAAGGAALLKEILSHTTRVNGEGKEQKVSQHFDRIYQGNYGELLAAIIWVLTENFGPFFQRHLGAALSNLPAQLRERLSV